MNPQTWWFAARAGGLVAWALAGVSVIWGLALSGRITTRPRPAWTLDLHRFLGGLTVVFTTIHVAALMADSTVHFGPAEIFVPLASSWRPVAVAWGIVAAYFLVAIEATSLLMRRLPRRFWQAVHLTSFVLYVTATVHLLTAGTDARSPVVRGAAIVLSAIILNLTVLRVVSRRFPRRRSVPADRHPRPSRDREGLASPATGA